MNIYIYIIDCKNGTPMMDVTGPDVTAKEKP
jgi:hypothetical protein